MHFNNALFLYMVFLNPWVLWAMPLVFLPLLIHLFNIRKVKTLYFSDNRFLQNVLIQHKQKQTLRYRFILVARMLLLLCIVLAFAKPDFNTVHKTSKTLIIYLDNSLSTTRLLNQGSIFFNLQNQLHDALLKRSADTRCILFTNDMNSKWLQPVSPLQCSNYVRDVKQSVAALSVDQVFKRLQFALQQSHTDDVEFWYFSDGQGMQKFDANQLTEPLAQNYFKILNADDSRNTNVSIDSCWMFSKHLHTHQTDTLYVALTSWCKEITPVKLKINIDGHNMALKSSSVKPNQKICIAIPLTLTFKGQQFGEVTLEGDAFNADNTLFFCLTTEQQIPVLLISEDTQQKQNPWLQILQADTLFKLTHINPNQCKPESVIQNQIIILNRIMPYNQNLNNTIWSQDLSAKTTIIFPHHQWLKDFQSNTYLNQWGLPKIMLYDTAMCRIAPPEKKSDFFNAVFLKWPSLQAMPQIQGHAVCTGSFNTAILKFTQGDPFLIQSQNQYGGIFFCTSDYLDTPNGVMPPNLSLPLLYEMVFSNREHRPLFYWTSQSVRMKTEWNAWAVPGYTHMQTASLLYPQLYSNASHKQFYFAKEHLLPGNYTSSNSKAMGFAVNVSRSESNPEGLRCEDLETWISQHHFKHSFNWDEKPLNVSSSSTHIPIWKFLVLLALLCLVTEGILLRQLVN
jgi:hypothetical protein